MTSPEQIHIGPGSWLEPVSPPKKHTHHAVLREHTNELLEQLKEGFGGTKSDHIASAVRLYAMVMERNNATLPKDERWHLWLRNEATRAAERVWLI